MGQDTKRNRMYPASFPQDSPGAGPRYQANNASTWKPPQPGGQAALAQLLMRELWNSSGVVSHTKLLRESWQVRTRQQHGIWGLQPPKYSPNPKFHCILTPSHTISHHLTPIQQLYKPFGADGSRVKLFPPETSTLFFRGAKSHGMAGCIKYRKFTTHLTVM